VLSGVLNLNGDEFMDIHLSSDGEEEMSEQDREFWAGKSLDLLAA